MTKTILTTLVLIFNAYLCLSQDVITKKSNEDIQAKVIEVTNAEVRYKKFDNQNGPTYTILKSDILIIRYENGTKDIFSEMVKNSNEDKYGKVYFIRSTGFQGSAVAFTAFIDKQLVCKLNNKKFSIHKVKVGEHTFSVQFAGKNAKEKAEIIKINIEEGKTYYIQMVLQSGLLVNNLYCQEVTENSSKTVLSNCVEDTKCD
jgi:hypothetical protein